MYCSSRRRQGGFVLRLGYWVLTLFFHAAIFVVALVGLANFWLPLVGDYKDVLEHELSSFVGNRVTIGQIRVDRSHGLPRWLLENLQLTEKNGASPIHIQRLTLSLDWRESLRTLRPQPAALHLEGVELVLVQQPGGLPKVQGLDFPLPGMKNTALNIERRSPIRLEVAGGAVHWREGKGQREIALTGLQLQGEIAPQEATLQAQANFPAEVGQGLAVDAVLKQSPQDGRAWDAKLNVRTQIGRLAALPLPQVQVYGLHSGALELDAQVHMQAGKPLHIRGAGKVRQLGWHGNADVPALDKVDATFVADNHGGKVQLALRGSTLNFPAWFERPLAVDRLTADLAWQVQEKGWYWQIKQLQLHNRELRAEGAGNLAMPLQKPAQIDLKLDFATQRTVDNVRTYIPALMPKDTEHWLKTAIRQGYVPKGEMQLRGALPDFPFDRRAGEFTIRFDIENGVLAYQPDWPEARDLKGELLFHKQGMTATVRQAKIMGLTVQGGTVVIPDMHNPDTRLLLDLRTQGELAAHMGYLAATPIGRNLRDFMQVAEFGGKSDLHLKLDVPLEQAVLEREGVKVDGVLTLQGNRFALPQYGQIFTDLRGQVRFDAYGVTVQQATGLYHDEPLMLSARTEQAKRQIIVELAQRNQPARLLPTGLAFLQPYLSGKAAVQTRLTLPSFQAEGKDAAQLRVEAHSDLQGVAIALPAPFGKAAGTARDLQVAVQIPFDATAVWDAKIALGKAMQVLARLPQQGGQPSAVGISLGGQAAELPQQGVRVVGEVAEADLLAWQGGAGLLANTTDGKAKGWRGTADIVVHRLRLGQQELGRARLQAQAAAEARLQLDAEKAQANVNLPSAAWHKGQVTLVLQGIDLAGLDTGGGTQAEPKGQADGLHPARFPNLYFQCQQCRHGEWPLEQLQLVLGRAQDGMAIKAFDLRSGSLAISAGQGRWLAGSDGRPRTELQAQVHIADTGQWLARRGTATGLQGGALTAQADLFWQGAPFGFTLAKAQGTLQVSMDKGSLSDVDPGVGRLLGAMDMGRLWERLNLDFHDMTARGVAFDRIHGTLSLRNGVLHTDDTIVEGAAMVAGIQGSMDLVHKRHQHVVTVVPNLRAALPAVGMAMGGVGGGAAMLLFNSVTAKPVAARLNGTVGWRYRIDGAWDNPQVTELKAPSKPMDVDVSMH